jgi:hypothetical protein
MIANTGMLNSANFKWEEGLQRQRRSGEKTLRNMGGHFETQNSFSLLSVEPVKY